MPPSAAAAAQVVGSSPPCGDAWAAARSPTARWTRLSVFVAAAVTVGLLCGGGGDAGSAKTAAAAGRFADDRSLKFVAVLFRHGDRVPFFKYKTDPLANAFPEKSGELTKGGKQHMYIKGQIFRRLYNGFLSDIYLDNEIIIKSTNMPRTQMSAAMVLAGLYPPKDYQKWSDFETVWQPIPIYHDSPDDTILFNHPETCLAFDSFKKKILQQLSDSYNITESLLSYLSEKCGQAITKTKLFLLNDAFKCQESANLQLPEWLKPNYLKTLRSIVENNKTSELFFGNPKMQKFVVGRLLQKIALEMELHLSSSQNQNTLRKMHLYSGHDIGIGNAMGFMKMFFEKIDFGASLHFHLHYDEKIGYTVKIFYFDRWDDVNGREVSFPKCGENCQLQEFINLVRDNFAGKWEEQCLMVEE